MKPLITTLAAAVLLLGCRPSASMDEEGAMQTPMDAPMKETREAVFAGGCFWCTEADFEKTPGVLEAISGYTGGETADPSYEEVSRGETGHLEAVKVIFNPDAVSYEELLAVFWQHIDPTDGGGQFVDRGEQYRSAVFTADERQRALAAASRERLARSGVFDQPVATEILPLRTFYEAEAVHQDYHRKNPIRYAFYRAGSGRDRFLEEAWAGKSWEEDVMMMTSGPNDNAAKPMNPMKRDTGQQRYTVPDDDTLRRRLTEMQYKVTREDATEPPFRNAYWDHHETGIYVDVVSGEPLFSSKDKFDSGTGWPSFTRPLEPENIMEKVDRSLFTTRTEVRSRHADSHLGHVFEDGPPPTGLRYCINSAALRFVPKAELEEEGYGEYVRLFEMEEE